MKRFEDVDWYLEGISCALSIRTRGRYWKVQVDMARRAFSAREAGR